LTYYTFPGASSDFSFVKRQFHIKKSYILSNESVLVVMNCGGRGRKSTVSYFIVLSQHFIVTEENDENLSKTRLLTHSPRQSISSLRVSIEPYAMSQLREC